MKLDSTFSVNAPIEEVWKTLMDFEKVAGCVPGAQVLNKLSEDAYQVAMKVKLGPVTMAYKGQMEVLERDETEHRAVLQGSAKEARGQGTAQATAHLSLVEQDGLTRGTVAADVALSGRAAAMGQGVIGSVTEQMMGQFAHNLQLMLNDGGPAAAAHGVGASLPAAEVPAAAATSETAPALAADTLNAFALARGVLQERLRDPRQVVQLLAVVALLAYQLGRRAVRRDVRRYSMASLPG